MRTKERKSFSVFDFFICYNQYFTVLSHVCMISSQNMLMSEVLISTQPSHNIPTITTSSFSSHLSTAFDDLDIYADSYEIESSFDYGFRQRSNTAVRLEKLRQDRMVQNQCKKVQWKDDGMEFPGMSGFQFDGLSGEAFMSCPVFNDEQPTHDTEKEWMREYMVSQ